MIEPALDLHKLGAARVRAATKLPYFAAALFSLRPVAAPGLGTFAVDRSWRLYCDHAAIERWTVPEIAAVLVHEVLHLLRDHAGRAEAIGVGPGQAGAWNLACDAEINDDLLALDLPLPGSPVTPKTLREPEGRLAEEYYRRRRRVPAEDCGSGTHGHARDWDLAGQPDAGVAPGEAALLRRQVAVDVQAAAQAGERLPHGLRRWAEDLLRPRVDWRRELRGAVRAAVADAHGLVDYSYRRPRRRAAATPGIVLPGLVRPVPSVAVVCDTSASIDEHQLALARAEVDGILAALGHRAVMPLLAVDSQVREVVRARRGAASVLEGGGGTDMGAGIAAALALRPAPQVVIVLTDGYTPWPQQPRGCRVVVGLLADARGEAGEAPPWSRVVSIGDGR